MIVIENKSEKVYSDGEITELRIHEIAKKYPEDLSQEYISGCSEYTINNTFSSVRRNLLNWYEFGDNASVLEVGAGMGALTGLLCDECVSVTALEPKPMRAEVIKARYPERENLEVVVGTIEGFSTDKKFDYAVVVGVLEYAAVFSSSENPYVDFLKAVSSNLKPSGKLLLAIENRYGAKYWLGAAEDHLQKPFAGIAGYQESRTPRTFSRAALSEILTEAGFNNQRFYSVLPDYKFPTMLFTEDWEPDAMDFHNVSLTYGRNSILTANEKTIYGDLLKNGVFSFFANSFLIEASFNELGEAYPILITAKGENKPEYRVVTRIEKSGILTKIAAHKDAEKHLKNIEKYEKTLSERGLKVLCSKLKNGRISRPIVDLRRADEVFVEALESNDLQEVLSLTEKLKQALLKSSPLSKNGESFLSELGVADEKIDFGPVLEEGYFDLTYYNAFMENGELVFYDQEWCFPKMPLNFILYYAIKSIFARSGEKVLIELSLILKHLQITEEQQRIYDEAEDRIWGQTLYREGDLYGEDGYCTQYHNTLKLTDFLQEHNETVLKLSETKEELSHVKVELNNKLGHIEQLLQSERDLQAQVAEKENKYQALKEADEKRLEEVKAENAAQIADLEQIIRNKDGHIEQLLEPERELNRIKSSRSWRYMSKFWRLRDVLVPSGSKRRLLVKMMVKFIKNPFRFLGKCTPKNIRKFFLYLKREGAQCVSCRLDNCLIGSEIQHKQIEVSQLSESLKTIDDYNAMEVPQWDNPDVSIVIPVYNQFDYTYLCVKSIIEHSGDSTYEIIIADDCSTDITKEIGKKISGLQVVRNEQNLRFLRNCNNAAKYARGRYILFLNNDTQVQENWLAPLVELMERSEDIGMVGSKLVYPDGRLQEAGGILWKDGSAWNYGNGSDPDLPEYNYVKETDYISGAAIMIRKELWEEIGGFDERFVPAYCEDSDLAFEVRKHGYKVLYQPLSVVVHFEGISNGTDTSNGQKKYQIENSKKFYEKWKEVLKSEHFENGQNVLIARERSLNKKTLLMVDHYVPQYDKDAGSRTVYQYIKLFVEQGYNVIFIGDNFFPHQPYTQALQQMGVEVLYGSYYANHWKEWLKENGENIDYAFLNRPHIAPKYIDEIRKYTCAKIIYYGHDLHFLRERREYEVTKDKAKLKSSDG